MILLKVKDYAEEENHPVPTRRAHFSDDQVSNDEDTAILAAYACPVPALDANKNALCISASSRLGRFSIP